MKFQWEKTSLLWLTLCVLCSHVLFCYCSDSCGGDNCSPNSGFCMSDNRGISLGQSIYRTATVVNGVRAVDLCFVVSAARSMNGAQRWLQIAVPIIEEQLKETGIGRGSIHINKYCLIQFGGRGQFLTAKFLQVNGEIFFPAKTFVVARRKLRRSGDVADGYEALEFAVKNVPFRQDPLVSKMLILVTNMGRSVLSTRANLTRESIFQALNAKNVVLDTVISAEMVLNETPQETVLGVNKLEKALIVRPNGTFQIINGSVLFTRSAGQTIHDYVTLSLAINGLSFPIDLLAEENYDILRSFVKAFIAAHKLTGVQRVQTCKQCICRQAGGGGQLECEEPLNQELCTCLVNGSAIECGAIAPTPTTTIDVTSILPAVRPTGTPVPLQIDGNVTHTPDGDVEVAFKSNMGRVLFECVLLNDSNTMPAAIPCRSPYALKNLATGRYRLLILGRYKEMVATKLFNFEVPRISGPLQATIVEQTILNGSVLVGFSASREDVTFHCSIGQSFFKCQSPLLVNSDGVGEEGIILTVLAIDSNGRVAVSKSAIELPTLPPPATSSGPVMITVGTDPLDLFGRLRVRFNTSRPDVNCLCRLNSSSAIICLGEFLASPQDLGPGSHELTIVCMDFEGYSDTQHVKFNLNAPPIPPTGQPQCNLTLTGPNDRGAMSAQFQCDRNVTATCQASNRPPDSCNTVYEFDIAGLGAGPHVFILTVDDGYGGSLIKINPFTVGTAQRKCCPVISHQNSSAIPRQNSLHVDLDISVLLGNCSKTEGFSYVVTWGDGASETGTSSHLANVQTSRQYLTTGNFTVDIAFCNSPAEEADICCDTLSLPVHVHNPS